MICSSEAAGIYNLEMDIIILENIPLNKKVVHALEDESSILLVCFSRLYF